jgi:hypothetical protein
VRGCVPKFQTKRSYARPVSESTPPACSRGSTTSNQLKIRPYSDNSIDSGEKRVVIDFGISVDARSLTAYAWRKRARHGTRTRKQNADADASIRLRGRLVKRVYYAVVDARTVSGERLCDARKLVVK